MWKRVLVYGALLAAGTLALQWLDYQRMARMHSGDIYLFLVAAAFLERNGGEMGSENIWL